VKVRGYERTTHEKLPDSLNELLQIQHSAVVWHVHMRICVIHDDRWEDSNRSVETFCVVGCGCGFVERLISSFKTWCVDLLIWQSCRNDPLAITL